MKIKEIGKQLYSAMMLGISHMIPVVVGGAIIMAVGNIMAAPEIAADLESGAAYTVYNWGNTLFGCMNYILAMYTSYAIANRAGLAPGLVVGLMAVSSGSGFLGAVFGGFIAGYLAKFLATKVKLPTVMAQAKPLLIIPVISCSVMFVLMQFVIDPVMNELMNVIVSALNIAREMSPLIYGGLLGGVLAAGMGSPIAYAGVTLGIIEMNAGNWQPFTCIIIGGTASCLGIAIAALVAKDKFTPEERTGVIGLLTGFACLVTEMCLPYALRDPKRVFPACFLGGFVGGALVMALNVVIPAMHGGMFVVPLANNILGAIIAILGQAATTAIILIITKPKLQPEEIEASES